MFDKIEQRWVIAPGVLAYWDGGRLTLQAADTGARYSSECVDTAVLLHSFAQPRTIADVLVEHDHLAPDELQRCIDGLANAGFIVCADDDRSDHPFFWDALTFAFHEATRGHQAHCTQVCDPPVLYALPLAMPDSKPCANLREILASRRSGRRWGAAAIPLQSLAALLNLSAGSWPVRGLAHRAYPAAGGLYTLTIYVVADTTAVAGMGGGLHRYDALNHELQCVSDCAEAVLPIRVSAGHSMGAEPPPLCLIITSRIAPLQEKYGELAYSLVMKEVGCLYQTLYLVAGQLGMAACALGCGTEDALFARVSGTDVLHQPIMGEFALGMPQAECSALIA